MAGSAPCRNLTLAWTYLGASRRTAAASWRSTVLSFWSGTRRRLTFAVASAGITVFAPSPVKPPVIPWISKVGRAQRRSSTEYDLSPVSAFAWTRCFKNSASRNGSRFQVASSTLEGRFTDAYRPGTCTLPSGVFKRPSRPARRDVGHVGDEHRVGPRALGLAAQQLEQHAAAVFLLSLNEEAEVHRRSAATLLDRFEQAEHLALVVRGAAREQLAVAHRRLERG